MNPYLRHRHTPAGSPLASALVIIVGILFISLFIAVGFVVFIGIAGFVLVMAGSMAARRWWRRRRFGHGRPNARESSAGATARRRIIEGEYHEVRPPAGDRSDR